MALFFSSTTSRHKHFFKGGGLWPNSPDREKNSKHLVSVFFSHRSTAGKQPGVRRMLCARSADRSQTSQRTDLLSATSRNIHNLLCNREKTSQKPLISPRSRDLFFFFLLFFSLFKRIKHATHKTNPHAASRRPVQNSLPSEFNTATLEKSSDKDRATLTVHIRTFENTLQQLTHIQPTECTYEQKKKKKKKKIVPVIRYIITFRLQTPQKKKKRCKDKVNSRFLPFAQVWSQISSTTTTASSAQSKNTKLDF